MNKNKNIKIIKKNTDKIKPMNKSKKIEIIKKNIEKI